VCIDVLYGDVLSRRRFVEGTFCMCAINTIQNKISIKFFLEALKIALHCFYSNAKIRPNYYYYTVIILMLDALPYWP
jgi:hypothetical protein